MQGRQPSVCFCRLGMPPPVAPPFEPASTVGWIAQEELKLLILLQLQMLIHVGWPAESHMTAQMSQRGVLTAESDRIALGPGADISAR